MKNISKTPQEWRKIKPDFFTFKDGKWVHNWFSNMALSPIEIGGLTWPSVENYFQAMKSLSSDHLERFTKLTPSKSKFEGRKLILRSDWETVKEDVMERALRAKFVPGSDFLSCLLETPGIIVEWNNWNDTYWGVDIRSCIGRNALGNILMKIRDEFLALQNEKQR